MFKKASLLLLCMLVLLSLLLTGCGCSHEWKTATCEAPKTCTKCNITEGEALEHNWTDADCETAKTCDLCKKTEGSALGHKWTDADCEAPKTCDLCKKTEGYALGHDLIPPTCETQGTCSVCEKPLSEPTGHYWTPATIYAPKTCSSCKLTEGTALPHDHEAAKNMYGVYYCQLRLTNEETGIAGFTGTLQLNITYVIRDHGVWHLGMYLANESQFLQDLENSYVAAFYAEFAKQDLNHEQADAAMKSAYGMDIRSYSKQLVNAVDWEETYNVEEYGVFYINNGMIYTAADWGEEFESETISVSHGILTLGSMPDVRFNIIG